VCKCLPLKKLLSLGPARALAGAPTCTAHESRTPAPPCLAPQLFYGILVQHFALLAGEDPLPLGHLDALAPILLGMTGEVPFYAATVARTRCVGGQ
jgi:hypothetical protein